MKTQKLLEKAKIGLILNEPFFASAALRMEYEEDNSIETGCTNGIQIRYNTDFFTQLSQEERKGFIAHEILHVISMHPLRIENRDMKLWNVACDYAINPLLKESGITLLVGALYNSKYFGMSAEEIYKLLPKEESEKGKKFGEVEEPPPDKDKKEMEQEAKQMCLDAYNAGKQAGNVSNGLKELIADLVEPKHNWKEILNRFCSEVVKNDYTWIRPNPRYIPSGLYLPILESKEISGIVFAIDTSVSIDTKLLCTIISEIKDAMSNFAIEVTVIHCDNKVQKVEELTQDDDIVPVGRGGTAFQPLFDYVNKHLEETKSIVYFTDGYASDKYKEPDCPVLWAVYDNKRFKPKFGEVIFVDEN